MGVTWWMMASAAVVCVAGCDEISVPPSTQVDDGFPDDPVAYWSFSGTLGDSSDQASDLTVTVSGDYVTDRFGSAISAYDMGVGEGPDYPSLRSAHVPFTRSFTIALWARGSEIYGSSRRVAGQGDWFSMFVHPQGSMAFGPEASVNGPQQSVVDAALIEDVWTFYVGVADYDDATANTTLTLYRDGEPVQTRTFESTIFANPGSCAFYVGMPPKDDSTCDGSGGSYILDLQLDDVRVYDRALNLEEIGMLYAEGGWPPQ